MGTGAAIGAWLRWGLVGVAQSAAAALSARHARRESDRRLSRRLRRRVFRGAARSRARVAAVRDHRIPRRPHDVLDVLVRSDPAAAARRVRDGRRPRARASRRLAAADGRRNRHVPRARRLSFAPPSSNQRRSPCPAPSASMPPAVPKPCSGKRSPSAIRAPARRESGTRPSASTTSTRITAAASTRCRCPRAWAPRAPASSRRSAPASTG